MRRSRRTAIAWLGHVPKFLSPGSAPQLTESMPRLSFCVLSSIYFGLYLHGKCKIFGCSKYTLRGSFCLSSTLRTTGFPGNVSTTHQVEKKQAAFSKTNFFKHSAHHKLANWRTACSVFEFWGARCFNKVLHVHNMYVSTGCEEIKPQRRRKEGAKGLQSSSDFLPLAVARTRAFPRLPLTFTLAGMQSQPTAERLLALYSQEY